MHVLQKDSLISTGSPSSGLPLTHYCLTGSCDPELLRGHGKIIIV